MMGIMIIDCMITMVGRYLATLNVVHFNSYEINMKIRSANMLGMSLDKPQ